MLQSVSTVHGEISVHAIFHSVAKLLCLPVIRHGTEADVVSACLNRSPLSSHVKVYASIILLRNLDPTRGMCNGTRLTVKAFLYRIIDAEIATGVHKGKRVFIPRIPMTPSDSDFPFVLRRRQFPIRPAFCITINKGQGQSLENVGIFLPSPNAIFSHGQLYVALSRVQNPTGLKLMVFYL